MASGDLKALKENATGGLDEVTKLQATDAEIAAGTENGTVVTPKLLADNEFQRIHVGTTAPADTTKLWLDTN